jgi:hypothetical protein
MTSTISERLDHHRSDLGPVHLTVAFVDIPELDQGEYGYAITFKIGEPRPEHIAACSTITRPDAESAIAAIQGYGPLRDRRRRTRSPGSSACSLRFIAPSESPPSCGPSPF